VEGRGPGAMVMGLYHFPHPRRIAGKTKPRPKPGFLGRSAGLVPDVPSHGRKPECDPRRRNVQRELHQSCDARLGTGEPLRKHCERDVRLCGVASRARRHQIRLVIIPDGLTTGREPDRAPVKVIELAIQLALHDLQILCAICTLESVTRVDRVTLLRADPTPKGTSAIALRACHRELL